ncbi:hypothetical protein DMB66_03335 [Actinoplanes sp. ATCC 53533]|uniref:hypothetical protein n=1 Tax=Actinoplanes sp. ATCC 53533 TaxID=1288362 RepID=UPI000F77B907|nr:hypothetical protein [Actinoplanes sp. ATCC 53533]RSM73094.1 hypothetical protein DMB66_03335 [Actinoplanes sp. ATCC 53533]
MAGASYDLVAARAGHASGALAVLVVLIAVLVPVGRWLGRHPGPLGMLGVQLGRLRELGPVRLLGELSGRSRTTVDVALSFAGLLALAGLLLVVIPPVVRFSGLSTTDAAINLVGAPQTAPAESGCLARDVRHSPRRGPAEPPGRGW